ncbi:hypothetical protein FA95DRAFT_1015216 [Auriscalpium vulgare]|uniref:Uncharacterized protein n=1 Tax=Auriscalpium vulgare TaxID=40419 RepID=A0ACB8RXX1_9AGAM|nr:hypothetical protein FA95DRAFT_1015216 [Auriscalpium vulgare]
MSTNPEVLLVYSFDVAQSEYLPTTFAFPPDTSWRYSPTLTPCTTIAGADHAGIFHPTPSPRMLSLPFSPESNENWFVLNVPADTLLAHVQAAPATVQWADWGPAGSRLALSPASYHTPGSHRSQPCLVMLPEDAPGVGPDGGPVAVLADFRPTRVAQARQRGDAGLVERGGGRLVENATADEGLGALTEARLPYVEKEFTMPGRWNGDEPYKVVVCEDQLFVFEELEDQRLVVKAWACTI